MTKIKLHPAIVEMHGKMGDMVFRRTPSGGMSVIIRANMSNVTWSEAQKEHRARFKAANAYAKAVMADETACRHYKATAERLGKRAYHLAVSDYFKGINHLPRLELITEH